MIFPDPVMPYINPFIPGEAERVQKEWRIISDQKWDLLQFNEFAR